MKKSILEAKLTDEQFAALAYKTRQDILKIIYDAPMCPRRIAEQLGGNIVYVKRHLRILLECDLVLQNLQGNVRQYQSNRELIISVNKQNIGGAYAVSNL